MSPNPNVPRLEHAQVLLAPSEYTVTMTITYLEPRIQLGGLRCVCGIVLLTCCDEVVSCERCGREWDERGNPIISEHDGYNLDLFAPHWHFDHDTDRWEYEAEDKAEPR